MTRCETSSTGVAIYGKTKSVDKGGSASRRERVPKDDWTSAELPELRIISDELWQRVQARKAKTREYFLHTPDGRLAGKPEAGLIASRMLPGIARCACGGALTYMGKKGPRPRYYCIERSHRGPAACSNRHGVPMDALDRAVLTCLLDDLLSDREKLWTLIKENDKRNRREREAQHAGRPDAEKHIRQLETEIGRLVAALAAGKASSDIATAIAERRAKVEALKAAPEPTPLDRQYFLTGYAALRVLLNQRHPAQVREALRKLGVDRIVVTRGADGKSWDFEGNADVGPSLNRGVPADHADSQPAEGTRDGPREFGSSLRQRAEDTGPRGMPPAPSAAAR
jgi:site-specific DNA recombinase